MTERQVSRILGPQQRPLPTGGLIGGVVFSCWHYDSYGLGVTFVSDAKGVYRVAWAACQPLIE
jgi:hypothetical protein